MLKKARSVKNTVKVIAVNSLGKITTIDKLNCVIPLKNEYIKREKVIHSQDKRSTFQDISAAIAKKVNKVKETQHKLKIVEKKDNTRFMSNIDTWFNNALKNSI